MPQTTGRTTGSETINFVYLSEIVDLPVLDAAVGKKIGTLVDLAATMGQVYPRITGLIVKMKGRKMPVYVPWNSVRKTVYRKHVSIDSQPVSIYGTTGATENEILLKKTFIDKQIISTSGFKVVRVNDLQLLIDNSAKGTPSLWVVHIDIGMKGLLRRLGWSRFTEWTFRWLFARDMKDKFVPWKYVQPTATANVYGSLHLKIDATKLSEIHPADLADIIEDLGTDERISLLESLDTETAAATLQEIPLRIRVQIAETLENTRLAAIVNDMETDEAVDLLDELDPELRRTIFSLLPAEKVADVKELSKLSIYSVGSIMNTGFIMARSTQTIREIFDAVKAEAEEAELIYYIYIVGEDERLSGMVTLREVLSAPPDTVVSEIMHENVISVKIDTSIKRVAQIFFKYNFEAVPVVDDDNRIQGIISLRDALESVVPEMREEAEGA